MITHQVSTSKYRTTIDIPAQKLHTKCKFLQIPKNSAQYGNQTIVVASDSSECNQKFQQFKKRQQYQTKLIIQELQQAYNQDMKGYQQKITELKHIGDIERLKLQNKVQSLQRQLQMYKNRVNQIQKSQISSRDKLLKLQNDYTQKSSIILSLEQKILTLNSQIQKLKQENKQKSLLLTTKLTDYNRTQDQSYKQQISSLNITFNQKINSLQMINQNLKRQLQNLKNDYQILQKNNFTLNSNLSLLQQEKRKLSQQIEFESKQIQNYLKTIKQLQKDIKIHKQLYNKQSNQIQQLLLELQKQRNCIQQLNSQPVQVINNQQFYQSAQTFTQPSQILKQKIISLENQLIQKQSIYLMKLKQLDQQGIKIKLLDSQLNQYKEINLALKSQITGYKNNNEKLSIELSNKLIAYNQLLSRPPEEKVYQVKIEKSIDKKQYILELETKILSLEKIIEQLKGNNESYVLQIKKRIANERQLLNKISILERTIEQLKVYIQKRQKSVAWVVQREISKDVEISQHQQEHKSKLYKVYVKSSSSGQSSGIKQKQQHVQISIINKSNKLGFSIGDKVEQMFHTIEKIDHSKNSIYSESKKINLDS